MSKREEITLPALPRPGSLVSAKMVQSIELQIAESLPSIDDMDVLEEWRRRASALQGYLRDKELQRPILGAQRRVEARIGQLLGEAKRGGKADEQLDEIMTSSIPQSADRSDFRLLARGFGLLADDEWRKSRRALVRDLRNKLGLLPPTPELPDGQFRCIVADPPWSLDTGPDTFDGTGERGHDALDYQTMGLEDIKSLKVADRAADDSHLYLWTTNRYIEAAYDVARAWGFKPSVLLVWAKKPHGIGLGDAYRLTTEFVLYARRGSLAERCIVERTWFEWPRGRHSEKPAAFYEMAQSVGHPPYLEMFARGSRPGWTVWGEEARSE